MSTYLGGTQSSYGSRVADLTPEQIEQNARDALSLTADFTPVVGEVKSGKEGVEEQLPPRTSKAGQPPRPSRSGTIGLFGKTI